MGYNPGMSDEYQIHIPPSFEAVYADARGRCSVSRSEFRERYELCEDMAQMLVDHSQAVHYDQGVSQDLVLERAQGPLEGRPAGAPGIAAHPRGRGAA